MTPYALTFLCEPVSKAPLQLVDAVTDADGIVLSGALEAPGGKRYPIIDGIPRFVDFVPIKTVASFGDEWNHFNFVDFKSNWLSHTVANTFGSIDAPPLRDRSIDGMVYCHNVIQHTPSVEKTAHALYALAGAGGEFVFNCYPLNDQGLVRWVRFHLVYQPLRAVLSRMPFAIIMLYARTLAVLRLIPVLGWLLEKSGCCVQGDVPQVKGESAWTRIKRRFKNTSLNTFDGYGSHMYQHHKSDDEIRALVGTLQPDAAKVLNLEKYFLRPTPIGCALRIFR